MSALHPTHSQVSKADAGDGNQAAAPERCQMVAATHGGGGNGLLRHRAPTHRPRLTRFIVKLTAGQVHGCRDVDAVACVLINESNGVFCLISEVSVQKSTRHFKQFCFSTLSIPFRKIHVSLPK